MTNRHPSGRYDQHHPELCCCNNHCRYRTRTRYIRVYHRRLVHGRQLILRWGLQEIRMDHCPEPTETCFAAASPTFRTTSRCDGSSSTHDIHIRFPERRLDGARRPSVCIHSKQTTYAQHGSSNYPQHPTALPPEPAPIPNSSEPPTSGFKPVPTTEKPAGVQPQSTSQAVKNRSPSKRAEASRSSWQNFGRGGSRR